MPHFKSWQPTIWFDAVLNTEDQTLSTSTDQRDQSQVLNPQFDETRGLGDESNHGADTDVPDCIIWDIDGASGDLCW